MRYLSGGLDSSIVSALAAGAQTGEFVAFTGRFDEDLRTTSRIRRTGGAEGAFELQDGRRSRPTISRAAWTSSSTSSTSRLPAPGLPQYVVSRVAAQERKVVLGGQGGDEIFGGYARYLLAYFEQCIKAAIEGTMDRARSS